MWRSQSCQNVGRDSKAIVTPSLSSADPYTMSCAPSQAHTRMHISAHWPEQMFRNLTLLGHDRTSSADPYGMACVPSQDHTHHAHYARTLTRTRNRECRLWYHPAHQSRTAQPFRRGEHTYTYHPAYTFVLASCKRLTRGWYDWWTKAYKLAPPLLK
jgi:hypothetical protein